MPGFPKQFFGTPGKGNWDAEGAPTNWGKAGTAELKNGSEDPPLQTKNGSEDPPLQTKNGSEDPPLQGFPWGVPGRTGSGALDPVHRVGAGVREFLSASAKLFAYRIPPDIAGDILYSVARAKNVIVVTPFPESAAMRLAKLEGRALFEEADEFEQVAAIVRTLDKNMKVVGHQTVGMKTVGMADGAFEQQRKDTMSGRFVAEIGL